MCCRHVLALLFCISAICEAQHDVRVHDPCLAKEQDTYYVISTGRRLPVLASTDLDHWTRVDEAISSEPNWHREIVPDKTNLTAPDLSYWEGRWHLYYSVFGTFGENHSAIGLATNPTLDPHSPAYQWIDRGVIVSSTRKDNFNAIDPNVVIDDHGQPWLSFGSFWSGLKLVKLDRNTGKSVGEMIPLADRPAGIEAPFIFRKGAYFYLFASFDACCRGINSTYRIMVGRSRDVTGPYVDRDNRRLLEGGGTLVLMSHGSVRGPGHNDVFRDGERDWLVHHFYNADNRGRPELQIRPLLWDAQGWPLAGEPGIPSETRHDTPIGSWAYSRDFGREIIIELNADGQINDGSARWSLKADGISLHWPVAEDIPQPRMDECLLSPDGEWFVGRDSEGAIVRGIRAR